MLVIDIANEQSSLDVDEELMTFLALAVLATEEVTAANISIAIVTDEVIHELNRRHLGHDYPTDVLSFLLGPTPENCGGRLDHPLEGEVIVSADTALHEANSRGVSPRDELALYLVHGLLHLCGHDDHADDDRAAMRSREHAVLSQFGIHPKYD